ncbi:MAG: extensin family protein [Xanthobacteraceae bacterium]
MNVVTLTLTVILVALSGLAAAEPVPLPRPRPALQSRSEAETPLPTACRQRLTRQLALAPSVDSPAGAPGCGIEDAVRLEAVILTDGSGVALTPPAFVSCRFAEAFVQWVRDDVVPAVRAGDARLKSIDNFASYDCRGRNRVSGAKLSEHGKGNALDMRSVKLQNGAVLGLTNPSVAPEFRERIRTSACARFGTVLGPGSDGYHEDHVHVDVAERKNGQHMCQWDLHDGKEEEMVSGGGVPLPRPRPATTLSR